jgi:hypothetical protein
VDAHRDQVVSQAGSGARVRPLQFSDQLAQPLFGIGRVGRLVQGGPVRSLDLLMQARSVRQFGDDIA